MMRFILLLFLIFSFECKKNLIPESEKKPIGEFFFYNDEVAVFEKPELSPILKKFIKFDSVKILETKIKDIKNPQLMFYKVYFGEQFGYVPIISEIQKNMFAFLYATTNTKAKIKASSLRIRETPDLDGKVIAAIPKGEIVEILWEGQLFEKIDLKYDTWMKIKTKDGKVGFSYAGYMTKNLNEQENYFSTNAGPIQGYVELKSNPTLLSDKGSELKTDDPSPCGYTILATVPKIGEIVPVKEISSLNKEKFYLIEGVDNDYRCYGGYRGWISEKDVLYVEDIYKYTSEKYGSKFDKKFLEVINENYNGKLNVKTLLIEDFQYRVKEKYKFYKVNYNKIFYLKNGQYFIAGNYINIDEVVDIDKDGNEEIVKKEGSCGCDCGFAWILVWNGNELKEIYNKYPKNLDTIIELEFKDKLVIENIKEFERSKSYHPDSVPKVTTNHYEIKNFELVLTKRRPK